MDEWKWSFELPHFNIQFLTLDLNHIRDVGGNWQTCRTYDVNSDQFRWYKNKIELSEYTFKITLNNASNPDIRRVENGIWEKAMENNTAVISGSGYYTEVSKPTETLYFNSSLIAGDVYADPIAIVTKKEPSYVLIICHSNDLTISLKNLNSGKNIYSKTF